MNSGVGSIGSPIPKSISSMPRARAAAFASSSRTNGYVCSAASTGDSASRGTVAAKRSSASYVRRSAAISTRSSCVCA